MKPAMIKLTVATLLYVMLGMAFLTGMSKQLDAVRPWPKSLQVILSWPFMLVMENARFLATLQVAQRASGEKLASMLDEPSARQLAYVCALAARDGRDLVPECLRPSYLPPRSPPQRDPAYITDKYSTAEVRARARAAEQRLREQEGQSR